MFYSKNSVDPWNSPLSDSWNTHRPFHNLWFDHSKGADTPIRTRQDKTGQSKTIQVHPEWLETAQQNSMAAAQVCNSSWDKTNAVSCWPQHDVLCTISCQSMVNHEVFLWFEDNFHGTEDSRVYNKAFSLLKLLFFSLINVFGRGDPMERYHLEDLGVDGRMILKL